SHPRHGPMFPHDLFLFFFKIFALPGFPRSFPTRRSSDLKPELQAEISNVDAYFGTNDLPELLSTLGANYKHELLGERLLTTPSHFAYFKIAEGCNRPCSFCAIPLMRGKHVSKSI